jgi:hypothetical protein
MAVVPAEETINFAKIDLSDGFWRMLVTEADKWNFAYVLPKSAAGPTRLIIPHALQMGWTESPGYFCAATETGRDILQALIDHKTVLPPHALDHFMAPETPARRQTSITTARPWQMSAVYVDDFILAAVENHTGTALQHAGRAALHTIHGLFPPPSRSGHEGGKDPISQKKLEAGDARWSDTKEILGFVFNGQARTVASPDMTQGPKHCRCHHQATEKEPLFPPKIPITCREDAPCGHHLTRRPGHVHPLEQSPSERANNNITQCQRGRASRLTRS